MPLPFINESVTVCSLYNEQIMVSLRFIDIMNDTLGWTRVPVPPLKLGFFPNSVALVVNFVIKDGLVAKICIIWNVLIKKKLRRGRQLPRPIQHVWDQPRTACTCMSSCEVPLYQSTPKLFVYQKVYSIIRNQTVWHI